ncbi:LOW QUALITY PROTEIN: immunoglobulin superfamily member 22 [Theristicus caerulescens]
MPSALLESFSMVRVEILAGESVPEFVEKPCPLATPEGDKAIFAKVKSKPKPNATWKRESVPIEEGSRIFDSIFKKYVLSRSELCSNNVTGLGSEPLTLTELKPLKVTERQTVVFEICLPKKVQNLTKFNGKELKWDDKYEIITSGDELAHTMKTEDEFSVETGDLVQHTPLFIDQWKPQPHKASLWTGKQRSIKASFSHWNLSPKPGISPAQEPMLNPAKAKPPVFIYKVLAGVCHFFLPVPSPGVPIQFISNLKNTQVKKKGKAGLECVLTSEDVTLKGMNRRVIERPPQYIMKHEGKRAELIINAAELSDSGDGTAIVRLCKTVMLMSSTAVPVFFCSHASTRISSRDICNHEEYGCDVHALIGDPAELCVVLSDTKVEGIWFNDVSCKDAFTFANPFSQPVDSHSFPQGWLLTTYPSPSPSLRFSEKVIRGFRDRVGDGVCCNVGCLVPQSSCQITHMKKIWIVKQGAIHKLVTDRMGEEHEGRYMFRAQGAESGATVAIGGSHPISLLLFTRRTQTLAESVLHQVSLPGPVPFYRPSIEVPFKAKPAWFKDGIEVTEEEKVVMEKASDCITIKTCVSEDSEAIMLNLKNDYGLAPDNPYLNFVTANTADKLKPPQGKAEFLNTGKCKMRWKAPKGNGGKQVSHLVIKKRMAGKKLWIKVGVVESNYTAFATEKVEEGKAYFRIRAINSEGLIKPLETEDIFAGEAISQLFLMWFHKPLRQVSQPQVVDVDVRKEDVTITWNFPAQDGGSTVQSYIIERRKAAICVSNTKKPVQGTRFKEDHFLEDTDEFPVIAVNRAGPGLLSMPSTVVAKDPIKPPGLLKVVDFSNSSISLAWQEPDQGDVLSGYILELAEDIKKWTKCTKIPISSTTYTVGGLQERQILLLNRAVNEAGVREAVELQEGILAMPPSGTRFEWDEQFDLTVRLKSPMVVCAGTAPCIHTSFPVRFCVVSCQRRNPAIRVFLGICTATWFTAAEKVYSNKYTVTGLLPGRKFFVIVCSDIGDTDPLDSQEQWYISKDRGDPCSGLITNKVVSLAVLPNKTEHAPAHQIKMNHSMSHGNNCTMNCAFISNLHPTVTLYMGNVSITSKLWFNSASSICLLMIPTTCSCKLIICDEDLAPEDLSDLSKAAKGASMDKRKEKYPEGLLS